MGETRQVTVDNFVRAETDQTMLNIASTGGFGKFHHFRAPTPIDTQTVVRMNRDTLYSGVVLDLDAGEVTITVPEVGKRFISLQVFDEDHFTIGVHYTPGDFRFTRDQVGTRYMIAALRTLVDADDPSDIEAVNRIQDAIQVRQASVGTLDLPNWDSESRMKVKDALMVLSSTMPNYDRAFGNRSEVDPVRHLIGTASAWGGNPEKEATYLNVAPTQNDGKVVHRLTVHDVPVDGFWSITIYNAEGYLEPNERNVYSTNNLTATPNEDGSFTIQFGGCGDGVTNCLPIMPGWNYLVRLYRPRPEVLDGSWKFPDPEPVA